MNLPNTTGLEVLAFKLGSEEYGLHLLKVQEIRGYENVTRIASAPDYIKGVINLRGIIVPILDMRLRLRVGEAVYNDCTVVIILNVGDKVLGMVVDSVSNVITLTSDQIKPVPEMATAMNNEYLIGLGTVDSRMLIVVDIEPMLSDSELGLLKEMAA